MSDGKQPELKQTFCTKTVFTFIIPHPWSFSEFFSAPIVERVAMHGSFEEVRMHQSFIFKPEGDAHASDCCLVSDTLPFQMKSCAITNIQNRIVYNCTHHMSNAAAPPLLPPRVNTKDVCAGLCFLSNDAGNCRQPAAVACALKLVVNVCHPARQHTHTGRVSSR
jgi:hypothetical protein